MTLSLEDEQALVLIIRGLKAKVADLEKRVKQVEDERPRIMRAGGGITQAQAIAAVEGEPTLDLTGVIPDSAYPNAFLLDGSRNVKGVIYVKCQVAAPIARYYVKKTDDTILPFFLYHETLNKFQMGVTTIPMTMVSPTTFNAYCTFNYLSIPIAIHPDPVAGSMYYDTATDTAYFYDGANWNAH